MQCSPDQQVDDTARHNLPRRQPAGVKGQMDNGTQQPADQQRNQQEHNPHKVAGEKELFAGQRHRVVKVNRQPVVQIVKEHRRQQHWDNQGRSPVKPGADEQLGGIEVGALHIVFCLQKGRADGHQNQAHPIYPHCQPILAQGGGQQPGKGAVEQPLSLDGISRR